MDETMGHAAELLQRAARAQRSSAAALRHALSINRDGGDLLSGAVAEAEAQAASFEAALAMLRSKHDEGPPRPDDG